MLDKPHISRRSDASALTRRTFDTPGATPRPAHEVLLDAAGVIVERGHHKRWFAGKRGQVCVVGAIRVAQTGDAFKTTIETPLFLREVRALVPEVTTSLVDWNDEPSRTKGQVIAALDAAAVVALQEAGIDVDDYLATRETP